ncbi:helix-turn-helix domain-containing protein, partial [Staphylococcus aureus]
RGYTSQRSLRLMTDEFGNSHMVIDETLLGRMETKLIFTILSFEIK